MMMHGRLHGTRANQRFEREGRILARLEHPHIARLLDAGVASDGDGGQTYLVLELVRGEPIDRWCDERRLDVEGRRLIDGFVADPLPVSAAADAQTVLALGFESPMPRRVNGPSRLLAQVTSSLTNNLMQARLAEAGAAGTRLLSIVPRLECRVGLFDTAAMPYLVDAGRRATEAALPAIRALLQREPQLAAA